MRVFRRRIIISGLSEEQILCRGGKSLLLGNLISLACFVDILGIGETAYTSTVGERGDDEILKNGIEHGAVSPCTRATVGYGYFNESSV